MPRHLTESGHSPIPFAPENKFAAKLVALSKLGIEAPIPPFPIVSHDAFEKNDLLLLVKGVGYSSFGFTMHGVTDCFPPYLGP